MVTTVVYLHVCCNTEHLHSQIAAFTKHGANLACRHELFLPQGGRSWCTCCCQAQRPRGGAAAEAMAMHDRGLSRRRYQYCLASSASPAD